MARKPKLAPRNPLVAPSLFRKAGAHDKSTKAKRAQQKQHLRQQIARGGSISDFGDAARGAPTAHCAMR